MADRSALSLFKKADAEGFLEKYSSGITSRFLGSTRIWCELHGSSLFIFKDNKVSKMKKRRTSALQQIDMSITQSAAPNAEECNNWIKTLQQAMMLKDQQQHDQQQDTLQTGPDTSAVNVCDYETIEAQDSTPLAPVQMRKSTTSETGYTDIGSLQKSLLTPHSNPAELSSMDQELDNEEEVHQHEEEQCVQEKSTNVIHQNKEEQKKSDREINTCQQGEKESIYDRIDEEISIDQKGAVKKEKHWPSEINKETDNQDYRAENYPYAATSEISENLIQLVKVEECKKYQSAEVCEQESEEYGYSTIGEKLASGSHQREAKESKRSEGNIFELYGEEHGNDMGGEKSRYTLQAEAENIEANCVDCKDITRTEADGIEDSSDQYASIGAFAPNPVNSSGAASDLLITITDFTSDSDGSRTPGDGADSGDDLDADDLFKRVSSQPRPIPNLPHPLTQEDMAPLKELQEFLSNNRHVCRPSNYDVIVTTDPVVDMKNLLQELSRT
ncbi:uncharacterized protein LOC112564852 isoform X3 [Pomacea canaliculata]|uniref:uncharacterized protein LOC112564852 isoform X3 n=1 Tax=Pomacea canaliculata TaxID=400727 RepID=UPI000D72BD89|nr:uncharacterized protein LOC112564852 isoform X3 [Pomacea canaliculata]